MPTQTLLTTAQIEGLRGFDTPTIANAIERFGLRSRLDGNMSPEIKCILPYGKTMIGYACTVKVSASQPPTEDQLANWMKYYKVLQKTPRPAIAVVEDIDPEPVGSFWGEVNATVHKSLGAVGVVTNGGVRDLHEVGPLGFGFFATTTLVSHGYIHIEEYNTPVTVGGVTVQPGDLLAADIHGVVLIPHECAAELGDACRKAAAAEMPVLDGCRQAIAEGKEVDLEELREWRAMMAALRSAK